MFWNFKTTAKVEAVSIVATRSHNPNMLMNNSDSPVDANANAKKKLGTSSSSSSGTPAPNVKVAFGSTNEQAGVDEEGLGENAVRSFEDSFCLVDADEDLNKK